MESSIGNQSPNNSASAKTDQLLHGIDDACIYYTCKKCSSTFTCEKKDGENNFSENIDPNAPNYRICKACMLEDKFHQSIGSPGSLSDHDAGTSSSTNFLSPLTQISTSSVTRSSSDGDREEAKQQLHFLDNGNCIYTVGKTHLVALSVNPPKNTSNYQVMNLYHSMGVYDQELEMQLKDGFNDKRIEKFFVGVDVIFKTDRKTFTSIPLLCPAKVYWESPGSDRNDCEVIVGILYDANNNAFPIVAIYDAFRQYKNLAKSKTLIHTKFSRMAPTLISQEFSDEEKHNFSTELYKFLKMKSALEEKDGKYF